MTPSYSGGERASSSPISEVTPERLLARELRLTLALLSRERKDAEALMDTITEGILQLGPGEVILRTNNAARALLDLPSEPEGLRLADVVAEDGVLSLIRSSGPGDEAVPWEVEVGGRRLLIRTRSLPLRLGVGRVVIILDLTDLQRFEGLRRDFMANASHELKTPLTSIRGYSELLLESDLRPAVRRDFLERILRNARHLEVLVEEILDLSRLDADGWRPRPEPVSLHSIIQEAWAPLAMLASDRSVRLELPEEKVRLNLDRVAIVRVFSNLFENAIRYTEADGEVRVRLHQSGMAGPNSLVGPGSPSAPAEHRAAGEGCLPMMTIEVSDTGTGIPAEALPRIFERFYRVDPARSRVDGGSGLGLSIVKHLVERMGGSIEAESEFGAGTTFRLRLPVEYQEAHHPRSAGVVARGGCPQSRHPAPFPTVTEL